jgi:ribosomal protein L15
MKNKVLLSAIMFSLLLGFGIVGSSFAATASQTGQRGFGGQGQFQGNRQQIPGVFGNVTSINGTNLTVASRGFGPNSATTTYSIDASKAIVMDKEATSTISVISVGNQVSVQGTITGTSVSATKINVGIGFGRGNGQNPGKGMGGRFASSSNMIEGNGQPIIGGTVSAVSGATITITNKSNVSYTVDASSATITKGNGASTVSDIAVGDNILAQGTINGTSVTATTVTDQGSVSANKKAESKPSIGGFFGGIGNFFAKLFGF